IRDFHVTGVQTCALPIFNSVERIININWEAIMPPPKGTSGKQSYLTAVTEIDNELVEILDVEKILEEISPSPTALTKELDTQSRSEERRVGKEVRQRGWG